MTPHIHVHCIGYTEFYYGIGHQQSHTPNKTTVMSSHVKVKLQ